MEVTGVLNQLEFTEQSQRNINLLMVALFLPVTISKQVTFMGIAYPKSQM